MKKEDDKISKEDTIRRYELDYGCPPDWAEKKFKEMSTEEMSEYAKYRKLIIREKKKLKKGEQPKPQPIVEEPVEENYYSKENKWPNEEKLKLVSYTAKKSEESMLSPEEKEKLDTQRKEEEFLQNYFKNHQIQTQENLNYAIEHDEKFRVFLEKTNRIKDLYKGRHLEEIQRKKEEIEKELIEEAKKDKGKKIIKKFKKLKPESKANSNEFKDSKKDLDLSAYRNKKMEAMGFILCLYLRKNGRGELRYVRMDEVGQIKVDGYVYHERDATYRFGKKNDPVLVIMEGALVPINKETLKEHLGFESAEAQKLVIKGIEQAEVVKASGVDENAKKPFTPSKWLIGLVIAAIIGIYAYMGGFS